MLFCKMFQHFCIILLLNLLCIHDPWRINANVFGELLVLHHHHHYQNVNFNIENIRSNVHYIYCVHS